MLLLLTAGGCEPSSASLPRAVERVAMVEFDNQSADPAAGPLGARVVRTVALQLAGAPGVFTYPVSSASEAPLRRATQVLSGYLTGHGGQWALHAQLRDASANRTLRTFVVAGGGAGALADGVASQLGKPGFAAAQLDPVKLEAILNVGGDASQLSEAARARLTPLPADFTARVAAALRASQQLPSDSETAYAAGSLALQARQFPAAAEAYRRAQRADPDWVELHNEAAFAYGLAGDLPAAVDAVERYKKLDPKGANPYDTIGEIYFTNGRFDRAEHAFLAAFDKDPAFFGGATLRKAAQARRMAGNLPEADRLFARYAEAAAKEPLLELEKARWAYSSGHGKEALAALESFAPKANASAVWSQLAAWRAGMGSGDAAGAAKLAVQTARTAGDQQAAVTAFFATQPAAAAAEWKARAGKQFPPGAASLARRALIYALMLGKHWEEAIPLLIAERDSLSPAVAGEWQAMLAIAYQESGQPEKAKSEARLAPIPRTAGDGTWEFLVHPRIAALVSRRG